MIAAFYPVVCSAVLAGALGASVWTIVTAAVSVLFEGE
jgi:hypothetical protein